MGNQQFTLVSVCELFWERLFLENCHQEVPEKTLEMYEKLLIPFLWVQTHLTNVRVTEMHRSPKNKRNYSHARFES